jgi:hypothetical protein
MTTRFQVGVAPLLVAIGQPLSTKTSGPAPGRVGLLGENALANLKISSVRFDPAFSLLSRFNSSASFAGQPGHPAPRGQLCLGAASCEGFRRRCQLPAVAAVAWPSEDRYKSIARALDSGANQGPDPPEKRGTPFSLMSTMCEEKVAHSE